MARNPPRVVSSNAFVSPTGEAVSAYKGRHVLESNRTKLHKIVRPQCSRRWIPIGWVDQVEYSPPESLGTRVAKVNRHPIWKGIAPAENHLLTP